MGTMSSYQVLKGFQVFSFFWSALGLITFYGVLGPSTPGTQRILDFFAALTHGALMGQISSPFPWLGPSPCPMLGHIWD